MKVKKMRDVMHETLRVLDSAHTHGSAMRGYALQRRDSGSVKK